MPRIKKTIETESAEEDLQTSSNTEETTDSPTNESSEPCEEKAKVPKRRGRPPKKHDPNSPTVSTSNHRNHTKGQHKGSTTEPELNSATVQYIDGRFALKLDINVITFDPECINKLKDDIMVQIRKELIAGLGHHPKGQ